MYLLDTNVLSELRRPDRAHLAVLTWANSVPTASVYVSAITILEIEIGAQRISRRDPRQGKVLRKWIDSRILPSFQDRILPVDIAIATLCASLHVPDRMPEYDSLIAATALVHGFQVVTRNTSDFARTGVKIVNPFAP